MAWLAVSLGALAHWVKIKNPNAPALKREAEEDHRFDGGAPSEFAFDEAEDAALLTRDEDA